MNVQNRHLFLDRNRIKSEFSTFFESKNLSIVEPAPLVSRDDKSVRFTGAAINRFKPLLGSLDLKYPGYATVQPCLRLFSLNTLLEKDAAFHICYFTMLGTIFHAEAEKHAIEWCVAFLRDICGVRQDRLKVKISSHDSTMFDTLEPLVQLETDIEANDFYAWKFGMDGISGRGITFSVWNEFRQKWGDIGNFIELWSPTKLIACEFSIGLEMVQYHLRSLPDFLSATTIEGVIPELPGETHWKLKDALSTLVAMYHGGILSPRENIPPQTKHGALARKALKNLVVIKHEYGVENTMLDTWIDAFSEAEFGKAYAPTIRPGLEWAENTLAENTARYRSLLISLVQRVNNGSLSHATAYETAINRADGACSLPPPVRDRLLKEAGL